MKRMPVIFSGHGDPRIALRDEGYLILRSGNVVHNLERVEWENPNGSEQTLQFNQYVIDKVSAGDMQSLISFLSGIAFLLVPEEGTDTCGGNSGR